MTKEQKTADK